MATPAINSPEELSADAASRACPACLSTRTRFAFRKYDFKMSECGDCTAVFTDPVPKLDVVQSRYSQHWFENEYLPSFSVNPGAPSVAHLASRFKGDFDLLAPFCKSGRLLDVGAAAGLVLAYAKQRGWEVHGVEPAGYGINFAKQHFGIDIYHGFLESAPFQEGFFDAIFFQDTIEHLSNPRDVVAHIFKLLKPGGVVLITTPNYGSLVRKMFGQDWTLISPLEHLCLFTPKAARVLLKGVGFEVPVLRSTTDVNLTRLPDGGQSASILQRAAANCAGWPISQPVLKKLCLGDELVIVARKPLI